jgi:hypothetical protein
MEPRSTMNISPQKHKIRIIAFALLGPLALIFYHDNPMMIVHMILVVANVLVIVGMSDLK